MKAVTSNDYRARIDRVLAHLADHLDADLSVAELARIAHFSPYHFHRMFRAMTGESVAALVRRLRLETAGRALRERDGSVIDVALAAGYGSPEGFTRAFQQAFAAAPSAYRRAMVAPRAAAIAGPVEATPVHCRSTAVLGRSPIPRSSGDLGSPG